MNKTIRETSHDPLTGITTETYLMQTPTGRRVISSTGYKYILNPEKLKEVFDSE